MFSLFLNLPNYNVVLKLNYFVSEENLITLLAHEKSLIPAVVQK